jgi:hypothetical protein
MERRLQLLSLLESKLRSLLIVPVLNIVLYFIVLILFLKESGTLEPERIYLRNEGGSLLNADFNFVPTRQTSFCIVVTVTSPDLDLFLTT